jgi:MFS family permease
LAPSPQHKPPGDAPAPRNLAATPQQAGEAEYREQVWRNLRRNFSAHLLHGLLGQTGMRLVNAPTFLPAYVFLLSGSDLVVGLARGLQSLGMCLSPMLGATIIEHRRRVLPVGFVVGGLMRLQVLGIALGGFFLLGPWRLVAVCSFLGLFGFFLGIQGVVFNYLMSKVIPVERRGRLLGVRNFLAGVTASAVVYFVAGYFIDNNTLGDGYAATFLVAFGLTTLGLCMLLLMREPQPPVVHSQRNLLDGLRDLPALLRGDRAFTLYFLSRALATMGRMAVPFYILYVGTRIELSGANLSLLTVAFFLAQTTMNLAWGSVADRTGFRAVFLGALVVWILSALVLMSSTHIAALCAVFVGLGAGLGGFMMSSQNMVLEFGAREDLPMRIAVANSSSELFGAVGPLLGGFLAGAFSYVVVFWVAIAFQLAAIVVIWRFVDEPRRRVGRGRE